MQQVEIIKQESGFSVRVPGCHLDFWLDNSHGWNWELVSEAAEMLGQLDDRTCSLDYKSECEQLEAENERLEQELMELKAIKIWVVD